MNEPRTIVAGAQTNPRLFEVEANVSKCLGNLEEAAVHGAQLVVFPECATTGYCFDSRAEAMSVAEPVPGPSVERFLTACRRLHVYTIVGMPERAGEKLYNSAVFLGPEGIVACYRKVHLPKLGLDRFADHGPGPLQVYRSPVGAVGLYICYDSAFPEAARVMALEGAEVLVHPTNWPVGVEGTPRHIVYARAIENVVFHVSVNRVGDERGYHFIGQSKIISPDGEELAAAGPDREEIIYASLALAEARSKGRMSSPGHESNRFRDRRPEFYGAITQQPPQARPS